MAFEDVFCTWESDEFSEDVLSPQDKLHEALIEDCVVAGGYGLKVESSGTNIAARFNRCEFCDSNSTSIDITQAARDVHFTDCDIHNGQNRQVQILEASRFERCKIHGGASNGLYVRDASPSFLDCEIYNLGMNKTPMVFCASPLSAPVFER